MSFLLRELESRDLRPSVRLFIDKALKDYDLWMSNQSEAHWQDLVRSTVEQQLTDLTKPTTDISRRERLEVERRIALEIHQTCSTREERVAAWRERTGGSQAGYYRRIAELKQSGEIVET